jgi:hypothetical protein
LSLTSHGNGAPEGGAKVYQLSDFSSKIQDQNEEATGIPVGKLIQVIDIYETTAEHANLKNMNPTDQAAIQLQMLILARNLKLAKESLVIAEAQLSGDQERIVALEPLVDSLVADLIKFKKTYRDTKTQLARDWLWFKFR